MKKSKAKLLIVSLACLGMGIGGVFAATMAGTNKSVSNTFDQAIYLYWGENQSSVEIADVTDLDQDVPQYRYLSCNPQGSLSVNGHVTLTFKIEGQTKDAKTYTMDGLKVYVYRDTTAPISGEPVLDNEKLVATLNYDVEADRTKTTSFAVTAGSGSENYCMKFVYDGSQKSGDEWGGLMTISQAFGA